MDLFIKGNKKTLPVFKPITSWQIILIVSMVFLYIGYFIPVRNIQHDSASMFSQALNLHFNDWCSPLTVLLWHGLNYLHKGFTLMLLLNFSFLWLAVLLGFYMFNGKKIAYWFLIIPFVPSIFIDAGNVLKDTIFSFGYMFIAMFLAYKTREQKDLKLWQIVILLGALFYFSTQKVQAKYIFPFIVWWICWLAPCLSKQVVKDLIIKTLLTVIISFGILVGMQKCNKLFIKQTNNSNYWQYVKIYDLSGMSVFANKMYVPSFLFKHKHTTVDDIKKAYEYLWEPLIVYPNSPLIRTQNKEQRDQLIAIWQQAVLADPLAYIKHRFHIWFKILNTSALKGKFVEWSQDLSQLSRFVFIFSFFSFAPFFPVFLWFWYLGIRYMKDYPSGLSLFMLSSSGLMLIFVLFFCSLAAAGRYIYFSWCCFMFAVPFAYDVYTRRKIK